jgi:hypothetical protein
VIAGRPLDFRALEGRHVGLALHDGSRIDDCQFVSGPRGHLDRVWICIDGADLFLAADEISDAWEAPGGDRRRRPGRARFQP